MATRVIARSATASRSIIPTRSAKEIATQTSNVLAGFQTRIRGLPVIGPGTSWVGGAVAKGWKHLTGSIQNPSVQRIGAWLDSNETLVGSAIAFFLFYRFLIPNIGRTLNISFPRIPLISK